MEFSENEQDLFKEKLLETYDAFNEFCKENNIRFYAAYGTAIGAVRHGGIIPWDDDLDVFMLEEDYNRFISLKNRLSNNDFEIVDMDTPGYYCSFAKFVSKRDSLWEFRDLPCMLGAYIDVFPVFKISGDKDIITKPYAKFCSDMNCFRLMSLKRSAGIISRVFRRGKILKAFCYIMQDIMNPLIRPYFKEKLRKGFHVNGKGEYYLTNPFEGWDVSTLLYAPEWFEDVVMMPFDGREIPVPAGYDAMLTTTYGDYMTPPPIEQRVTHHAHYYFNLDKRVTIEEARKEIKENGY